MGMVQTTSLSLISTLYADNLLKYIGYLETGAGLGNASGPIIGSSLFALGGYSLPFWSFCGIFVLLFFSSLIILPPDRKEDKESLVGSIIMAGT